MLVGFVDLHIGATFFSRYDLYARNRAAGVF
jgi:hypothetical protein